MITCGDCGQTFQKFNSFKSHIQRKHNSRNHHEVEEGGDLDLSAEEDQGREDDAEEPKSFVEEMTRSLPLFMLKTTLVGIQYTLSILFNNLKSILHLYFKYTLSILNRSILKVHNFWSLKKYT